MDMCSYGHDEVVYVSGECPVCDLQYKLQDMENERDEFEVERDNFEAERDELQDKYDELVAQVAVAAPELVI